MLAFSSPYIRRQHPNAQETDIIDFQAIEHLITPTHRIFFSLSPPKSASTTHVPPSCSLSSSAGAAMAKSCSNPFSVGYREAVSDTLSNFTAKTIKNTKVRLYQCSLTSHQGLARLKEYEDIKR
jgi:hypothetical protein